jgi:hypothetical protein
MTLEQFVLTALVQTILLGLLAILCFIKFRSRSLMVRLIGLIFLLGFLANMCSWLMTRTRIFVEFSNVPSAVCIVISIVLLSHVYIVILFRKNSLWVSVVAIVILIIAFFNFHFIQRTSVNSNLMAIHSSIFICYSLWYFYVLIRDLPSLKVHQMPMFWFNSAFLVLGAGTFVLYAFTSYLIHVLRNDMITYWSIHNLLSIFAHLIVLIGLYFDFRQLKKRGTHSDHRANLIQKESPGKSE